MRNIALFATNVFPNVSLNFSIYISFSKYKISYFKVKIHLQNIHPNVLFASMLNMPMRISARGLLY